MRSTLRSTSGPTPRAERRPHPAVRPRPERRPHLTVRPRPVTAAATVAALALTALAALAGCTSTGSSDNANTDHRSAPVDGATVSPAPPGKYRTLPQPCSAVNLDSLKQLVPGATDYAGAEALTYDTDRLVGCTWKGRTPDGSTSSLSLSMVRVVSYDPAVSDEVEAESDFEQRASVASIPPAAPSGSQTTSPPATSSGPSGSSTADPNATGTQPDGTRAAGPNGGGPNSGSGSPSPGSTGTSTGTGTGTSTATGTPDNANAANGTNSGDSHSPDLAPRRLPHVGNAAFIDDVLKTRASGPNRTVTLVFRTANVLATVTYSQSAPHDAPSPQSADLQKAVQKVAGELEGKVER